VTSHAKRARRSECTTEVDGLGSVGVLEAIRLTQHSAGWLVTVAEVSNHPDAAAAARWLEDIGSRSYVLAAGASVQAADWINACVVPTSASS